MAKLGSHRMLRREAKILIISLAKLSLHLNTQLNIRVITSPDPAGRGNLNIPFTSQILLDTMYFRRTVHPHVAVTKVPTNC